MWTPHIQQAIPKEGNSPERQLADASYYCRERQRALLYRIIIMSTCTVEHRVAGVTYPGCMIETGSEVVGPCGALGCKVRLLIIQGSVSSIITYVPLLQLLPTIRGVDL